MCKARLTGTLPTGSNPGEYIYTPAVDYDGPDSFTFKVNNGYLDSPIATVHIDVGDSAPMPNCRDAMTGVGAPVTFTLTATHSFCPGDPLTFTIPTSSDLGGTITDQGGDLGQVDATHYKVKYTPLASFEGSDHFTFTVNDGSYPPVQGLEGNVTIRVVSGPAHLIADCRPDKILLRWKVPKWLFDEANGASYFNGFRIYRCDGGSGECNPITVYTTVPGLDHDDVGFFEDTGPFQTGNTYCYKVSFLHQDICPDAPASPYRVAAFQFGLPADV